MYDENHAILTFAASATHFVWSTTHRLWSRSKESTTHMHWMSFLLPLNRAG